MDTISRFGENSERLRKRLLKRGKAVTATWGGLFLIGAAIAQQPSEPQALSRLDRLGGVAATAASGLVDGQATISGRVVDSDTGRVIPATVAIRTSQGSLVTESPSFKDGFRSSGTFTKAVPPGKTTVTVTRGFDYGGVVRNLSLRAGQRAELVFELRRRTPLRSQRWVTGDNHVHMIHGERNIVVTFEYAALAGRAEGLDYMSLAQDWNLPEKTAANVAAACRAVSTPDFTLTWNLEAPKNYWRGDVSKCLGHGWTLGMRDQASSGNDAIRELLELSAGDYQNEKAPVPNFEIHNLVHSLGGIVSYTHPCRWWWGRWGGRAIYPLEDAKFVSNLAQELPYDTVIGPTYDTIDILMQPREQIANDKARQLWFMLLNQGYRIPATASSDTTFDNEGRGVPGKVRVYTRVDGEPVIARIAEAMKRGRNFITSGPLLTLEIGGHGIGDAIRLNGPASFKAVIKAWASGEPGEHLSVVELIRNGQPVKTLHIDGRRADFTAEFEFAEDRTAWYIAHAAGSTDEQIAITNPIYFEAADYRAPSPAKARVAGVVKDRQTGKPLGGVCEVVVMSGVTAAAVSKHEFRGGRFELEVPGSARLRVRVPGYVPVQKSVFMDYPPLANMILNLRSGELVDWTTFQQIRALLDRVRLEFALVPERR